MGCGTVGLVVMILATFSCASAQEASPPPLSPECDASANDISSCYSYINKGSTVTTPEAGCCSSLSALVLSHPLCLCQLLGNFSSQDVSVDVDKTVSLSKVCRVSVHCSSSVSGSTNNVPTPSEGPPTPVSRSTDIVPTPSAGPPTPVSGVTDNVPTTSEGPTTPAIGVPLSVPTASEGHTSGITSGLKVMIGVSVGIGGLLLIIVLICRRNLSSSYCLMISHWEKMKNSTDEENILKSFALQRYKYVDLKKMTNSFTDELGKGGFGRVYKGKLKDGRLVAVKLLDESKGNGADFINEVATIGGTNHVNIVRLLGYCNKRTKQALVYEYMPNGSLERFIYNGNKSSTTRASLGWEKLYQIALGIAKGLAYLHRDCNTRILHFDIKPHNILLDQDLCPKISDFGLAKLCPTGESIVSLDGTRGTRGYIAPEVELKRVSHKSDVYSYGMMVFEIVGGRKNLDASVENDSAIYLPHWTYSRLEREIEVEGSQEIFEVETTKKMIIVALWCIQQNPTDRPSMSKVVEMLEGKTEELPMPPNPFQDPPS